MKIALLGYGKMGQEIERLIKANGRHKIVSISFKQIGDPMDEAGLKDSDVVIDFTAPEIVIENISQVAALGKAMVIGTTGWYDQVEKVKKIVAACQVVLIYAQNFSVGANIFFRLAALTAQLTAKFGNYDVYGFEIHHSGKKDSPSGTALRLGQEILNNFPEKKSLQLERLNRQINLEEFHLASVRGGRNPGFHQLVFDSAADAITLSQTS